MSFLISLIRVRRERRGAPDLSPVWTAAVRRDGGAAVCDRRLDVAFADEGQANAAAMAVISELIAAQRERERAHV